MPGKRMGINLACLSAVVVLCVPGAFAQSMCAGMSGGMSGKSMASVADKKFVKDAMEGDMAEIQLGQLALQKASSEDVKQFAQKIIDDHTKLDEQVKPIAMQVGVTAPTQVSAKDRALMTKLQSLSGSAFDKAYVTAIVADHAMDDKKFKAEETGGKDPKVKDAATQAEPVIAQHLQMAKDLKKKMG